LVDSDDLKIRYSKTDQFYDISYEEDFSFPLDKDILNWDDEKYLGKVADKYFSEEFINHIHTLWITTKNYLITPEIPLDELFTNHKFKPKFIEKFGKKITKTQDLILAFFQLDGYKGKFGLEIAKARALEYYDKNGIHPRSMDFSSIAAALSNGYWEDFDITSWPDFIIHVFGEYYRIPFNYWNGEEGLEKAKVEAFTFYEDHNRKPTSSELNSISNIIYRGIWKEFGIESWHDFLMFVFGETNRRIQGEYSGSNGLQKAKKEALEFQEKEGRKPFFSELRYIADFIYKGNWIEFGIERWNDFLSYVFGELNKHPTGYYQGKIGLERAKQEAIAFEKEYGRKPFSIDNYSIHTAIRRGYYTEFGISTFHEFLLYVFNEFNVRPSGYYEGNLGLQRAKNEALDYFDENNRQPTSNDLTSIMNAIYRENWKDYGINTWYDFLVHTFGEANFLPPGYYRGRQGLINASNKVKKFKMENGKIPITSDFPSINNVITQKEWVRFGINCWIDFINYVFDENLRPKGYYDGKQGLKKAVEEVKDFERKNGTKPGCRDLPWIHSAISEMKKWVKFGISSWNDFLKYVFGSVKKRKSGYYKDKIGLDRAMKEGIEFIELHGQMPKIKDLPSIANGVYRKYWGKFGIKNWKCYLSLLRTKME